MAAHDINSPTYSEFRDWATTYPIGRDKCGAFSLVELSIVLVILGLLTGGILGGQSLIRAAELRAVTTEYNRYASAVNTFKDKYFAIPGDMSNATQFWGRLNTDTTCVSKSGLTSASTPGACDGNGNGLMEYGNFGSNNSEEGFQFWRQLALAGLIEGSYTGLNGSVATYASDHVLGTNAPKSRMSNAGWATWYAVVPANSTDTSVYVGDYGNLFGVAPQNSGAIPCCALLKPEEAWNIDTKIDDGKPATGKVWARESASFHNPATSTQCTTSTSNTDYAGNYNLSNSSIICGLFFVKVF